MLNTSEFSERIKKVMNYYGLSASNFAEKIDVPRSSISHILSGRNKPSLEFVLKINKEFNEVDLYWLLNNTGSFPKTSSPTPRNDADLFSSEIKKTPTREPNETTEQLLNTPQNDSNIKKVMIFYNDGTFEEFKNRRHQ